MIQKLSVPSIDALRESQALDDLWQRSGVTSPMLRSACLANWQQTFGNGDSPVIVRSVSQDRWTAALPLTAARMSGNVPCFRLASNPWMQCADLLVDRHLASEETFDQLAFQISGLPASFLFLEGLVETPGVVQLIAALRREGCEVLRQPNFETGLVRIQDSWDEYLASLSKNHRKHMRRSLRRLQQLGPVEFERFHRFDDDWELEQLLGQALAMEDRSWKGCEGSSLIANEDCRQFYIACCRELAAAGMLEIQFLKVGQLRVAFEIGCTAKSTWHSHKVSFDPDFAEFSPGQLLLYLQLKHWHESRDVATVDTMGVLSPAVARWCNESRMRYRYRVAIGGPLSRCMLRGFRRVQPWAGRLLRRR